MSEQHFNQRMYESSVEALTKNGVPYELAEEASAIVASETDTCQRTPEQQALINELVQRYNEHQNKYRLPEED